MGYPALVVRVHFPARLGGCQRSCEGSDPLATRGCFCTIDMREGADPGLAGMDACPIVHYRQPC